MLVVVVDICVKGTEWCIVHIHSLFAMSIPTRQVEAWALDWRVLKDGRETLWDQKKSELFKDIVDWRDSRDKDECETFK